MFLRNSSNSNSTSFLKAYVDQLSTHHTYEPPEAQDALLELAQAAQERGPHFGTENGELVRLLLDNIRVAAQNGLDPTQSSIASLWLSYGRVLKVEGYKDDSIRVLEEALRHMRSLPSWPALAEADKQFVASLIDELVPLLSDNQLNERAVDLQRDLIVLRQETHRRVRSESSMRALIQNLNQLGDLLLAAGQPKAARTTRMEALELHHDIDGPVTFLSNLRAHASWLLKAGFDEEAYQTAQEAYRKQGPLEVIPQYKPYLADGQFVLARFLVKAGRLDEAFSIWEETITAHREHRVLSSGPPPPDITSHMREYRDALLADSRFTTAFTVDEEIVTNMRRLYAQRPTLYTNNLAKSLWNYSDSLTKAGRLDGARDALEETVQLYRGLFLADRSMYSPVIAPVLCEYACVQHELSISPSPPSDLSPDVSEAVASTAQEAIRITRWVLWAKGSTTSRLLSSLDRLAGVLLRREEWETAQDVTNEIRRLLPHPSTSADSEGDEKPTVTLERVHALDKMCRERTAHSII
ncbi:hypothetical protein DL93DRAFT_1513748 [Clavulina sp. PMI_390]|nr:hypothetical protein DL93DRAFT_1513748 [Clavulina sp. PMI_390]